MFHNKNIQLKKRVLTLLLTVAIVFSNIFIAFPEGAFASGMTKLSEGVLYQNTTHKSGSTQNRINLLEVNLADRFT